MKKYTLSIRYKLHSQRVAERALKHRIRSDKRRRHWNRVINHIPKAERAGPQTRRTFIPSDWKCVVAPDVFSLIRNPEEVSSFISKLKLCYEHEQPVFVDLKQVVEIDLDGIAVLLSVVVRFKALKIGFNGNLPLNKKAKVKILDSGFFDCINGKSKDIEKYSLQAQSSIYTHAQKNVDSELGENLITSASQIIWGVKKRCPGVQRAFVELMQNTNNHASPEGETGKHWWLSMQHVRERKKVLFSFVDYGVGVFHSLNNKRAGSKFYGVIEDLRRIVRVASADKQIKGATDSSVLKLIFEGQLHRSATGRSYRGKGLPGVYQAFEKGQISNLAMITNNAYFNSANSEYTTLNNEFPGTFIYWELQENNFNIPFI